MGRLRGGLGCCHQLVGEALVGGGLPAAKSNPQRDGFPDAVQYYLKGDYYQAEDVLERLIETNTGDADARLMLATLLRHAGRFDEAIGQLDLLALVGRG